ncbi:DUF2254 domain-containing protein [Roseomonas sp. PWR1]|uniref:DUF2254 domain-containing protein n=1 Tax=Roseomonas nitratireducens TaxID=2820810 RepID=A0ABS4AY07_9PROT|nr:DUF2254 domain-containing protein [Neoroseomonas nitratireducens]MBP0466269.1 DUF2254 domain-containing protein [Neoroseomonas nitratireducens]
MPVWLIPIVYTLGSLVAALALPRIEHALDLPLDLGISAGSALAVQSAIASGMMALTGIVFSVAFVMLQFSAVTYSPRFASRFARDPVLFHALGIFFATFSYSLAAAAWVDREGSGRVPAISSAIAVAMLFVSMVTFGLLLRRLGDLQITNTLRYIGDQGRDVIKQTARSLAPWSGARGGDRATQPAPAPVTQVLRHAGSPRYVQRYDIPRLIGLAQGAGACIEVECAVGDMMMEGSVMLRVRGGAGTIPEAALRGAVRLGADRTFEQDPKYPLRLLVDIAIKALSPAINDPTTAVQALDQIEDLLRRLARHELEDGRLADASGTVRLVFPTPEWEDYLALAFDEIRVFGATSVQVMRRLRSALVGLAELLGEHERAASIERYLRHMDAAIEHSPFDEQDRAAARQEDPQGLGLTR